MFYQRSYEPIYIAVCSEKTDDGLILWIPKEMEDSFLEGPYVEDNSIRGLPTEPGIYLCTLGLYRDNGTHDDPHDINWEFRVSKIERLITFPGKEENK